MGFFSDALGAIGSVAGGAIGSVVPGVGTALGASIGGGLGSAASGLMGGDEGAGAASGFQMAGAQQGLVEQARQYEELQRQLSPYLSAGTGIGAAPSSPAETIVSYYNQYLGGPPRPETLAQWMQNLQSGKHTLADAERIISGGKGAQAFALSDKPDGPKGALPAMQEILGLMGPDAERAAIDGIRNSPLMDGIFDMGEEAIRQNASATGGLRGGNVQELFARFRPEILYQMVRDRIGDYGGLISVGQNAAALQGNAGQAFANNASTLYGDMAAAQAGNAQAQAANKSGIFDGVTSLVGGALQNFGGFGGSKLFNAAAGDRIISGTPWKGGF